MPKLRSLIISALKLMQLLVEALKVYAGNPFTSEGSGAEADKITHGARLSCLTPVALPLQNLLVSGRRRALRCTQSAEEDSYPRVMLLPLKKNLHVQLWCQELHRSILVFNCLQQSGGCKLHGVLEMILKKIRKHLENYSKAREIKQKNGLQLLWKQRQRRKIWLRLN